MVLKTYLFIKIFRLLYRSFVSFFYYREIQREIEREQSLTCQTIAKIFSVSYVPRVDKKSLAFLSSKEYYLKLRLSLYLWIFHLLFLRSFINLMRNNIMWFFELLCDPRGYLRSIFMILISYILAIFGFCGILYGNSFISFW